MAAHLLPYAHTHLTIGHHQRRKERRMPNNLTTQAANHRNADDRNIDAATKAPGRFNTLRRQWAQVRLFKD